MNQKSKIVEWIGGIVRLPASIYGEGEPYFPEGLFWLDADGLVQGMAIDKPGVLLSQAAPMLSATIAQPMVGGGRKPTRIRVASSELAAILRDGHPHLGIACAPTPELDEMLAHMQSTLGGGDAQPQSYLSADVDAAMTADFFSAAADLFRAHPWKIVPDDQCLLQVSIEALGLRDGVISVIGQTKENLGFLLFPGMAEFDAYVDLGASLEGGELDPSMPPLLPRHLVLGFEKGADIEPALRKEIAAHGWEVAGRNAYPRPLALEDELLARPPSAHEMRLLEGISRALAQLMSEGPLLCAAWEGGESVTRVSVVATHAGSVEVTLSTAAPLIQASGALAGLLELELIGDGLDLEQRGPFEDALIEDFVASPEGMACTDMGHLDLVLNLAADYLGNTIAGLDASGLRELLFEIMPRKASVEPAAAGAIIRELRAFYSFLKRAHGFYGADSCLRVLGNSATAKLEAALADSSKYGMAKALVMSGRDAGFDLSSQEGIDAWTQSMQGKPLPSSVPIRSAGSRNAAPGKAKEKAKQKRKAANTARRKNR